MNTKYQTQFLLILLVSIISFSCEKNSQKERTNNSHPPSSQEKELLQFLNASEGVYNSSLGEVEWKENYCSKSVNGQCQEMIYPFGIYNAKEGQVEWKENYCSKSINGQSQEKVN